MTNKDNKQEKGLFDLIKGLTQVDPAALGDFKQTMTQEVIPEIVEIVEKRRMLAAESRHKQLKC